MMESEFMMMGFLVGLCVVLAILDAAGIGSEDWHRHW
jgi:hypothetical protein